MSLELESAYESLLFRNELPATWRLLAFRSEANLREFLKDLDDRIRFFKVRILCSIKPKNMTNTKSKISRDDNLFVSSVNLEHY